MKNDFNLDGFTDALSSFESDVLCLYVDGNSYNEIAERLETIDDAANHLRRVVDEEDLLALDLLDPGDEVLAAVVDRARRAEFDAGAALVVAAGDADDAAALLAQPRHHAVARREMAVGDDALGMTHQVVEFQVGLRVHGQQPGRACLRPNTTSGPCWSVPAA